VAKRYSIAEARSNLPTIVDQAEAGLEIELTRRGKPVAALVSLRQLAQLRGERPRFNERYKTFLKKYSLKEVGFEEGLFEATRDRSVGRKVSL
jgi:prevent-host-death family protein